MESDSLDGAIVDTARPSPNSGSQIMGDGEGTTCDITSDFNNASDVSTANENGTRLFSKIKSKVGLNKNKERKVIKQKQTSISNESNNGNGKQISINNGNNISISNHDNLTCDSDITQDSSCEGVEKGEVIEYIGEGIHTGKSVDEVDFANGSQKRPLSHSSDDTVNSADFAGPVGPAPRPSRKKPAVVVSMGQSRSVVIGDGRFLMCEFCFHVKSFSVVSLYAPNRNPARDQFLEQVGFLGRSVCPKLSCVVISTQSLTARLIGLALILLILPGKVHWLLLTCLIHVVLLTFGATCIPLPLLSLG